jgi:predicted amidophosphoribosyltransferase
MPPSAVLVLVDDVVTSGATLCEAAAALGIRPPGAPPLIAAVVAATPRTRAPDGR